MKGHLAWTTAIYVLSLALPAMTPSQRALDLSSDPTGPTGFEVVMALVQLLFSDDGQLVGWLTVGGLLLSNLGIVAAWMSVTAREPAPIAPWVAAGCGLVALAPLVVDLRADHLGAGDRPGAGYFAWAGSLIAAAILSFASRTSASRQARRASISRERSSKVTPSRRAVSAASEVSATPGTKR